MKYVASVQCGREDSIKRSESQDRKVTVDQVADAASELDCSEGGVCRPCYLMCAPET